MKFKKPFIFPFLATARESWLYPDSQPVTKTLDLRCLPTRGIMLGWFDYTTIHRIQTIIFPRLRSSKMLIVQCLEPIDILVLKVGLLPFNFEPFHKRICLERVDEGWFLFDSFMIFLHPACLLRVLPCLKKLKLGGGI